EHLRLPRLVAIKVFTIATDADPDLLQHLAKETYASAQLQHPNIVSVLDAGEATNYDPNAPTLRYFVMEYVPGQDLQTLIETQGPLQPEEACGLIYQLASALEEAHRHHLV